MEKINTTFRMVVTFTPQSDATCPDSFTKNLSGQIRFFSGLILCNHSETFDTGNNPFVLETLISFF